MPTLADLYKNAGATSNYEPKKGDDFKVEVKNVTLSKTKAGFDSIGAIVTILDGDDKGGEFWVNVNFSENDAGNARSFGQLLAMGVPEGVLASADSLEGIKAALKGNSFRVECTGIRKTDAGREFPNLKITANPVAEEARLYSEGPTFTDKPSI